MINATIHENRRDENDSWPKLMRSKKDGDIVLFEKHHHGVLLYQSPLVTSEVYIGDYYDCWLMDEFEPFHGEITLRNE